MTLMGYFLKYVNKYKVIYTAVYYVVHTCNCFVNHI